jgi:hypothetical protein
MAAWATRGIAPPFFITPTEILFNYALAKRTLLDRFTPHSK